MIATLASLKLEPKLLSSRSIRPFIWYKTWGVNQRALESVLQKPPYENGLQKTVLFLYFRHLLHR